MQKFRKKPVEVQAEQYNGGDHPLVTKLYGGNVVQGKQGMVAIKDGDWIIAEMDGSGYYPCNPEVFAVTYEAVEDDHTDMRA